MMGDIPQSPTKMRPRSRDTGFPEPFCGTGLPRPDADLSPNACISADDVPVGKVLHRSRRSFLAKHKRTISYGKVLPEAANQLMYSDSAVVLESEEESPSHEKHDPFGSSSSPSHGRPSKDSLDGRPSSSLGDDEHMSQPQATQRKRRSLLRKFRKSQ